MAMHFAPPDLGLGHAIGAARTGARFLSWLRWVVAAFPGICALGCWVTWAFLRTRIFITLLFGGTIPTERSVGWDCPAGPGVIRNCYPTSRGTLASSHVDPAKPIAAFDLLADKVLIAAACLTIAAVAVFLMTTLLGQAAKQVQRRGSRVAGAVKGAYSDVQSDIRKGKSDVERAKRAHAKAMGVVGWMRGERPEADEKKPDKKGKGRKGRKALESEWASELARIDAARSMPETVAHLDPTAGPPEPPTRSPSPDVEAYRDRARAVEARTGGTMRGLVHTAHEANGWVGYTPPAAPVALEKEA